MICENLNNPKIYRKNAKIYRNRFEIHGVARFSRSNSSGKAAASTFPIFTGISGYVPTLFEEDG